MKIINGKEISEKIINNVSAKIISSHLSPRLEIIFVGLDKASATYVNKKSEAGAKAGIIVNVNKFETISKENLKQLINRQGDDPEVHGIIIQLPLPDIDVSEFINLIPVQKDVDGLNPLSLGIIWQGSESKHGRNIGSNQESSVPDQHALIPATAKAILKVLEEIASQNSSDLRSYLSGKNALIINRSLIIGRPLAGILLNNDTTVTVAHSKTKNIAQLISQADIIISATGKSNSLDLTNVKEGVVVIDVGFSYPPADLPAANSSETAPAIPKVSGDTDKATLSDKISYYCPVPGGIGPIGVACLIENTYEAATLNS